MTNTEEEGLCCPTCGHKLRYRRRPGTVSRPWTGAEIKELKRLRSSGKSTGEIAETLGRSYGSVSACAYLYKIPRSMKSGSPSIWTDEQKNKVLLMRERGATIRNIAKAVGRSAGSVTKLLENVEG